MRRLEHDLNRFTIELEADTAGITEILEQSKRNSLIYICIHMDTYHVYMYIVLHVLITIPSFKFSQL